MTDAPILTRLGIIALRAAATALGDDPDAVEAAPTGRRATHARRYAVAALLAAGLRPSAVAHHFGRHPSQVTRASMPAAPDESGAEAGNEDVVAAVLRAVRPHLPAPERSADPVAQYDLFEGFQAIARSTLTAEPAAESRRI